MTSYEAAIFVDAADVSIGEKPPVLIGDAA